MDHQRKIAGVVGRQGIRGLDQAGIADLPAGLRQGDLLRQRDLAAGRGHTFQAIGQIAQGDFAGHAAGRRRVVANLDFQPPRLPLDRVPIDRDRQHRQVLRRLGRRQRFELDLNIVGQGGKIGAGPIGPLEIADDHQFAADRRSAGFAEHLTGQGDRPLDVQPLGQHGEPGQLVAQGAQVARQMIEHRPGRGAAADQAGTQPALIGQQLGGPGPGAFKRFDPPCPTAML